MTVSLREQFRSFRGIVEALWKITIIQVIIASTLDTKLAQLQPISEKIVTHFPQMNKLAVLKNNPSYETKAVLGKLGESQDKVMLCNHDSNVSWISVNHCTLPLKLLYG